MMHYKNIKQCRVCHSERLLPVLNIKEQHIATTFVKSNKDHPMANVKIPLTLILCQTCGLVQLLETVHADLLYQNYFYRTAVNETMRRDLNNLVYDTLARISAKPGDYVVDIGANDCAMISMFPGNLNRIGVEPAKNIHWDHVDKSILIINDYFSKEAVLSATKNRKVKIITSTAMFYDLDDPNKAAQDIKDLLEQDGICTIQVSYLATTIKDMNFYDIVHEHLEYYTLGTMSYLFERNGLSIFDAETNAVNGGSLRVYITHKENKRPRTQKIDQILAEEEKLKLREPETYDHYGKKITQLAKLARYFILNEIKANKLVIGLGASTKGNVMLQICGITKEILPYISERNKEKVDLRTLGTDIALISEEAAHRLNPSTMLVIPWNFKEEIVKREHQYIQEGGKLLFLMPYPYYIDREGEKRLDENSSLHLDTQ